MVKIAVLDDWQGNAPTLCDWSKLADHGEIVFFRDPIRGVDELAAALSSFDIILSMRERTAFPQELVARLPKLRMLGITGPAVAGIDMEALTQRRILVCNTDVDAARQTINSASTAEMTLGLMIAANRQIAIGDHEIRAGRFQGNVPTGFLFRGKTLGVIGLGRIGAIMAGFGRALGMNVLAWSQNLTEETALAAGATKVSKEELLERADAVTLHLRLSERSRDTIDKADIARMRHRALLINTSRGPLINEAALLAALHAGAIVAGIDVFAEEPLPLDHPLRTAPNCVLTPHLGYSLPVIMADYWQQSIENALAFIGNVPIRIVNPEALG